MLGDTDTNAFASVIGGANSKRCKFYSATRVNLTNRDNLSSGDDATGSRHKRSGLMRRNLSTPQAYAQGAKFASCKLGKHEKSDRCRAICNAEFYERRFGAL